MAEKRLRAFIESRYDGKGINQAEKDLKDLGRTGTQSAGGLGKASTAAGSLLSSFGGLVSAGVVLAIGRQIMQVAAASVQAASRVEEMESKFAIVFGKSAPEASQALREFGMAANRSRYDLQEMAASVQDTFVPLGFARDVAADMSVELVRLATDVASFNNATDIEVMRNFQSGLVGNHEALRSYGIVITEATLKQELARMGAENLTGAALEQSKVQARLNLIIAGTSDAQGDAERTSGSYANASRGLEAAMLDLKVIIGEGLLPELAKLKAESADSISTYVALMSAVKEGAISGSEGVSMLWKMILTGKDAEGVVAELTKRFEEQAAEMARAGWTSSRYNNLSREGAQSTQELSGELAKQVFPLHDATEAWGKMNEKASDYIPLAYRMETLAEAVAAGISGELQQAMEGYLSTTEDINQEHGELQEQLDDLLERGWSPTSEKVLELQGRIDELKTKEQEAGEALAEATAQMIYQQAAAGLDAGASLELARAMGILSEQDYAVSKTLQDLRMSFDANADGMINASEGARDFAGQVANIYEAVSNLQAQDVPITFENIQAELEKIDLQKTAEEMDAAKLAAEEAAVPLDAAASGLALVGEKAEGSRVPIENFEGGIADADAAAELAKKPMDDLAGSVEILGGQAVTTKGLVNDLATAIDNLPSVKNIDIYYRIHVEGTPPKGRQHGGPVEAGVPYMIGETGPELFVSPLAGRIISHGQMNARTGNANYRNIGGDTYNIHNYTREAAVMTMTQIELSRRRRLNQSMSG